MHHVTSGHAVIGAIAAAHDQRPVGLDALRNPDQLNTT
jgi:hypothetical protein